MGKSFGEYIKDKRKENKLTLMEAANLLNISFTYLSDLENGRKMPPNSTKEEKKEIITKFKKSYNLSDEEYEQLLLLADQELIDRGHISNDVSEYMSETIMATVALRRAKNKNLSNDDWRKILNQIDKLGD